MRHLENTYPSKKNMLWKKNTLLIPWRNGTTSSISPSAYPSKMWKSIVKSTFSLKKHTASSVRASTYNVLGCFVQPNDRWFLQREWHPPFLSRRAASTHFSRSTAQQQDMSPGLVHRQSAGIDRRKASYAWNQCTCSCWRQFQTYIEKIPAGVRLGKHALKRRTWQIAGWRRHGFWRLKVKWLFFEGNVLVSKKYTNPQFNSALQLTSNTTQNSLRRHAGQCLIWLSWTASDAASRKREKMWKIISNGASYLKNYERAV